MRVAVVGAGNMGGMHAAILGRMAEVDELLVVDADEARAREVAQSAGGTAVEFKVALDRAEAVVLATPAELHPQQVAAALDADRSVLCEKPLADTLDESIDMARRAAAPGTHLEVGFQRRHDTGFVAARRMVADGELGRLHLVRLTAFDPLVRELETDDDAPIDAAPLFLYSSIHDFDFVRWVSGQEVVEVQAEGATRRGRRPADARAIESAVVTMMLADGTLAILAASWLHPSGYDIRVELLGARAHVTAGLSDRSPVRHLDWTPPGGTTPPPPWSWYLERFEPAYEAELGAFLAASRGTRPPATTARDGLEAMRIAVAATRSYRERRAVRLSEVPGLDA